MVGDYDEALDQGIVRVYPAGVARGVKLFCLGDLDPAIYTAESTANSSRACSATASVVIPNRA